MPEPTIPGAVDLPGLADDETAYRWDPADLHATGWLVGVLSATDATWRLHSLGDAPCLMVRNPDDARSGGWRRHLVARPGDVVIVADSGTVQIRTAASVARETDRA